MLKNSIKTSLFKKNFFSKNQIKLLRTGFLKQLKVKLLDLGLYKTILFFFKNFNLTYVFTFFCRLIYKNYNLFIATLTVISFNFL